MSMVTAKHSNLRKFSAYFMSYTSLLVIHVHVSCVHDPYIKQCYIVGMDEKAGTVIHTFISFVGEFNKENEGQQEN